MHWLCIERICLCICHYVGSVSFALAFEIAWGLTLAACVLLYICLMLPSVGSCIALVEMPLRCYWQWFDRNAFALNLIDVPVHSSIASAFVIIDMPVL